MAKNLPKRAACVDPEGKISWAYNHVTPGRDWDVFPPVVWEENLITGEVTSHVLFEPGDTIVDLTGIVEPDEFSLIVHEKDDLRLRQQPDKTWKLRKVERTMKTHDNDELVRKIDGSPMIEEKEVDHPLEKLRPLRRAARQADFAAKLGNPLLNVHRK